MLALYLPRLPMGGIERATVTLANYWASKGRPVTLLLDRREGALVDALSPELPVAVLDAPSTIRVLPRLVAWLRRNRPAMLHSALPHNSVVALAAGLLTGTRITIAEHSVLSDKLRMKSDVGRIVPLMRALYPRAGAILAPSEAVARDLRAALGLSKPVIQIVGNPIVADSFDPRWLAIPQDMPGGGEPVFIAIGRLAPVKDFPTLLRAFRFVVNRRPAHLLILGEGEERARLIALATELDLVGRLTFPGVTPEPLSYIAQAATLVVSSLSEGFCNVIVEAMACGTQIVSTRCGAPVELLRDGALGALTAVGDAEALGAAMLASLDRRVDRAALMTAAASFTVSAVAARYESALGLGWGA